MYEASEETALCDSHLVSAFPKKRVCVCCLKEVIITLETQNYVSFEPN